ncbi:hypothetical protein BKA70DRAFT_1294640 [Coprinopsis sp. MPI-PUGE-AT-0042]|nr:hypothetical protein BKA70DRAFT_1294640 [Coprinopsis sp. MPI-PUGE-AT-0042]
MLRGAVNVKPNKCNHSRRLLAQDGPILSVSQQNLRSLPIRFSRPVFWPSPGCCMHSQRLGSSPTPLPLRNHNMDGRLFSGMCAGSLVAALGAPYVRHLYSDAEPLDLSMAEVSISRQETTLRAWPDPWRIHSAGLSMSHRLPVAVRLQGKHWRDGGGLRRVSILTALGLIIDIL